MAPAGAMLMKKSTVCVRLWDQGDFTLCTAAANQPRLCIRGPLDHHGLMEGRNCKKNTKPTVWHV